MTFSRTRIIDEVKKDRVMNKNNSKFFSRLFVLLASLFLAACGGGGGASDATSDDAVTHAVTATASAGGTVDPTSTAVNSGESTSITVTPNAGFLIAGVSGCGGSLSGNTYTTGAISADCTVSATFSAIVPVTHTVTATAGAGGNVDPSSATVATGGTTTVTVTPDAGFSIVSVSGCGGSLSGNAYTTGAITADCTVSATFSVVAPVTHSVTATAGSGGSISPGSATVLDGGTASFAVTPDAGFLIAGVSGCGGSLSGNTYTTGVITADCTVSATFSVTPPVTHTVTATAGSGGSINPGSATVLNGGTTSFTVTPDTGFSIAGVSGCGGGLSGNTYTTGVITADCTVSATFSATPPVTHTVTATAGSGGSINPGNATVLDGGTTSFTVSPDAGFLLADVTGCGGALSGNTYTTGTINADCTVSATFSLMPPVTYSVTTSAGGGGSVTPGSATVIEGANTVFTITPDSGFRIDGVSGCDGSLSGNQYTTGAVIADCTVTASFVANSGAPVLPALPSLSFVQIKTFRFSWTDVADATFYRLLENPDGISGFTQIGGDIVQGTQVFNHIVTLHERVNAQYILQSCNAAGCTDSPNLPVSGNFADSVGYFKASNTERDDIFGIALAMSGDGNTLAVGASAEASGSSGVNGDQSNGSVLDILSGAVYVFARDADNTWQQQAYLKASNNSQLSLNERFGSSVSLSHDGSTLAVSATGEASAATGINGDQDDTSAVGAGAVYVFTRTGVSWTQQAYVKASNTQTLDTFGTATSLSGDGNLLAVGALGEDSGATGVNGDQTDNSVDGSGAVYIFSRSAGTWSQQAFLKASTHLDVGDIKGERFGSSLRLSRDGSTLAVGAPQEDGSATGINGDETLSDVLPDFQAGAVYVFVQSSGDWTQQAYIKASNTDGYDLFGTSVALSANGNTLAVGAVGEASSASGIDGDQSNGFPPTFGVANSGAVYLFGRTGSDWVQTTYLKAGSNLGPGLAFGYAVDLSDDGTSLLVSALGDATSSTGIVSSPPAATGGVLGAVYVYKKLSGTWSQIAFAKASNTLSDRGRMLFGYSLGISADGSAFAAGAPGESSAAVGINGNQNDVSVDASSSGAAYLY